MNTRQAENLHAMERPGARPAFVVPTVGGPVTPTPGVPIGARTLSLR